MLNKIFQSLKLTTRTKYATNAWSQTLKASKRCKSLRKHFSDQNQTNQSEPPQPPVMDEQYDVSKHTLLGRILCFHDSQTNQMSYAIHQPANSTIHLIDPLEIHTRDYLGFLDENELKIGSILLTSKNEDFNNFYEDLKFLEEAFDEGFKVFGRFEGEDVVDGGKFEQKVDIKPWDDEDLCFCFLEYKGFDETSSLLSVTHVTDSSTKIPLLFTGDLLRYGSIGDFIDPEETIQDINLVKSFPQDSLFFPKVSDFAQNYDFVKKIDPNNQLIEAVKEYLEGSEEKVLLNGLIRQELFYNPYMRLETEYFKDITNEAEIGKRLLKIRKFEESL